MTLPSIRRPLFLAAWLTVLIVLPGCNRSGQDEAGVVATVNGRPITLSEVEYRHDLEHMGLPESENPTVEKLRAEYGEVLAELVIQALVAGELDKLGLAVTDAEMAAAEAEVRADYPGERFDTMLLEEHVELARWRAALLARLQQEKLVREVLKKNVRISVPEAADYYKEHIKEFTRPQRLRLVLIRGRAPEAVKKGLALCRETGDPEAVARRLEGVAAYELALREKNLPKEWRTALKGIKPGEATGVMQTERGAEALLYKEAVPETVLDPAKAYAQVEATLSAGKLAEAYGVWLSGAVGNARIRVNGKLMRTEAPAAALAQGPGQAAGQSGDADIETERQARDYVTEQAKKTLAARREGGKPPVSPAPAGQSPAETAVADAPQSKGGEPQAPSPPVTESQARPVAPSPSQADSPPEPPAGGGGAAAVPASAKMEAPAKIEAPAKAEAEPTAKAEPRAQVEAGSKAETEAPAKSGVPAQAEAPAKAEAESPAQAEVPAKPEVSTKAEISAKAETPAKADAPPPAEAPTAAARTPPAKAEAAKAAAGKVEFIANKSSWIVYTVDDAKEERVYLKAGKPTVVEFGRKLSVKLGSPSDVTYRYAGKETAVSVSKKETRALEFP